MRHTCLAALALALLAASAPAAPAPGVGTGPPESPFGTLPAAIEPSGHTGFSLTEAAEGCAVLQRLFVPIGCVEATVNGAKALLVGFFGEEPASSYIERFASRITKPFCGAARGHDDAPVLFFTQDEPDVLREYACDAEAFREPFRASAIEMLK